MLILLAIAIGFFVALLLKEVSMGMSLLSAAVFWLCFHLMTREHPMAMAEDDEEAEITQFPPAA